MNWIANFVRPRIKSWIGSARPNETPENLWKKCSACGEMIFHRDLKAAQFVCPQCGNHMRIPPAERFAAIFDAQSYEELAPPEVPLDPLKFRGEKRYTDELKGARAKLSRPEALSAARGTIDGLAVLVAVQPFDFLGGSLGMGVGEGLVQAIEHAVAERRPFVLFVSSGGARMQEGIMSLMQMPRVTIAVDMLRDAGLPYLVVLTDPTFGGVERVLCDVGRRPDRRTRRPHRLHRCTRHQPDDTRATSRRLPKGGVPAFARHGRYGRSSPRIARDDLARPAPHVVKAAAKVALASTGGRQRGRHAGTATRQWFQRRRQRLASGMSVAALKSDAILTRLAALHPNKIELGLDRITRLLAQLGHPEKLLPPVIHVAGTNGKGSVCAFSRAMLEAQGFKAHVYISPHLVHFHERIRLAGKLIAEDELAALLEECERVNDGQKITYFEITTAAAILAFSRHPADALILEVGLGGKYDATNVISKPRMTIITPIGYDHIEFFGSSIADIAAEKAGIIKSGVPVIVGPQDDGPRDVILRRADALSAPVAAFGQDFFAYQEHGRMVYQDESGLLDLPLPRLIGRHQIENAAVAIAGLRHSGADWGTDAAVETGLRTVDWPARLQRLSRGPLVDTAPKGSEIWLDGGHNPHCAAAVARAVADFEDRAEKPLYLICGMLKTKDAVGFLSAFRGLARHVITISVPGEESFGAGALYDLARSAGLDAAPGEDVDDAMMQVSAWARAHPKEPPPRVLICGSLYLAGRVLARNT